MDDEEEAKAPASRMKFAPLAREKKEKKEPKAKAKGKSGEPGAPEPIEIKLRYKPYNMI